MTTDNTFQTARDFILREGRVLEQRLFATIFEDAPASGVLAALAGYRNADGGFGHGLEPDKLCPGSLAIDVEIAFRTMDAGAARRPRSRLCGSSSSPARIRKSCWQSRTAGLIADRLRNV